MELEIGKDDNDDRRQKVQERQDHFAATKVAEGDEREDPRKTESEDKGAQREYAEKIEENNVEMEDEAPPTPAKSRSNAAEHFDIGSPAGGDDELIDGPGSSSDRRVSENISGGSLTQNGVCKFGGKLILRQSSGRRCSL